MARKLGLLILAVSLIVGNTVLAQHDKQRFHGTTPGHKVDYQKLLAEAQAIDDSPAGQAVLANCLLAYGGMDKLATLDGFRILYENSVGPDTASETVVKTVQRGRKYRTIKGIDTRLINDLTCWYEHEDQVAELNDTRYRAELFSYLTLTMPYTAKTERFDSIRYGKEDGDPLDYLYFAKTDSLMIILGVDPESHLIKKSTGVIPQGDMNFVYINEFSDFKDHEGFIFPNQTVFYSLGMRVGQSTVQQVEINPVFKANEFLPRNKLD